MFIAPLVIAALAVAPEPPRPGYDLVWQEEFDGTALDESKWSLWALGPRRDAINTADAVSLDGHGRLVITTSRHANDEGHAEYHTGGVWTRDTFRTRYGYFEARMKVQTEVGFWSAFWVQSPAMGEHIGDPANGGVEIDVMEYLCNGKHLNLAQHTIHWDGYGDDHKSAHHELTVPDTHVGFHVYALEWTPDELIFFIDGKETWRTDKAVPRIEQYIILSCEVGKWAGDIADADLPDRVLVDWVRVWQKPD
ncbi:MAG: glycoside hydrolase family 16 protein [Phycisphaeraceae bacterium]|nr:MAG: glycoside hydrolase family 16 protein [Phycisphaeraceae bacterium]